MARKKKRRQSPVHTPLARHKKAGSRLVPPLAELPVELVRWDRNLLPEYLWIASLRAIAPLKELHKPHSAFMDAVDEFWTEKFPALGLLSDFGYLEASRDDFLAKHAPLVRKLFLEPFGRILAFFPDSPAHWLVTPELCTGSA